MWHYYLMGEISGCKGKKSSEDGQLMDLKIAFQWVCHFFSFQWEYRALVSFAI